MLADPSDDSLKEKFNNRSFSLLVAAFPRTMFVVNWNEKLPNIEPNLLRQTLAARLRNDLVVSSPDQFYFRVSESGKRLIQHPRKSAGLAPRSISILLDYHGLCMSKVPSPEQVASHHNLSLSGIQQSIKTSLSRIRADQRMRRLIGLST